MTRKQRLFLVGIFLLAAILRCLLINSRNIQYDDAFSYFLARVPLTDIIRGTAADTMPPLYYLLLHFWQMIANEIWFLRLLSVILSLGAIFFLFSLLRSTVSISAGLWAAFYAAISPLQIYHAQDIRMYALLAFCGMGYLYFFFKAWEANRVQTKSIGRWLGLFLFGAGGMYTHNLAIFWIISPVLFVLLKRDWKFLWKYLLALMAIGLAATPWLILVPGQIQKIQNAFWTPRPGPVEIIQSIMMLTFNLPEPNRVLFVGGAILAFYIFILVLYHVIKNWIKEPNLMLLLIVCFVPPTLLFLSSYLIRPVFVIRGFIPSQLAFLGLAGAVTSLDWKNRTGGILAGLIIVNALISYPALYSYAEFPRSPFAEASGQIQRAVDKGNLIVHDNKLSYFPIDYYFHSPEQVFLKDEPGSSNDTFAVESQQAMGIFPEEKISSAAAGKSKLVFVVFQEAIREYEAAHRQHPVIEWLGENYKLARQQTVGDLVLIFFESAK
jgi:mannosyltransferase